VEDCESELNWQGNDQPEYKSLNVNSHGGPYIRTPDGYSEEDDIYGETNMGRKRIVIEEDKDKEDEEDKEGEEDEEDEEEEEANGRYQHEEYKEDGVQSDDEWETMRKEFSDEEQEMNLLSSPTPFSGYRASQTALIRR
jgi:hypothetical protein